MPESKPRCDGYWCRGDIHSTGCSVAMMAVMSKPEPKGQTAEQVAAAIYFDRRPDHHDGEVHGDYCVECHRCGTCAEKEIAIAIKAEREAAYLRGSRAMQEKAVRLADAMQDAAAKRLSVGHDPDAAAQHDTAGEIAEAIRRLT